MNLSHLVTCCTLRWEVVAEQTTFFFSWCLSDLQKKRAMSYFTSSDCMKFTGTILPVGPGPWGCTLSQAQEKVRENIKGKFPSLSSSRWKTFPWKYSWRLGTVAEFCQGQNPRGWAPSSPFLWEDTGLELSQWKGLMGQHSTLQGKF